jgi:SAM-dependent methyltransferase
MKSQTSPAAGSADGLDPAAVIRLGTAFCEAKAVLSAVELGLFSTLSEAPGTAEELTTRLGLHARGTGDFLDLLVSLGLLERVDGRYHNAAGADRHLVRGKPTYVGGFLERANHNLYPAWGRLTQALRTGEPQSESDFLEMIKDPAKLRRFTAMMDALTDLLGPQLAQAFDWSTRDSVLDIGGARGNLVSHLVKAHPGLHATVFDLPEMRPLFDEHAAGLGLLERMRFHGGDFFADPLPPASVVVIGHVLHDWAADERRALVEKAYAAVRPGGALLIYDRMLDTPPTSQDNLIISLDMLLTTRGGAEYPIEECTALLDRVGCTGIVTKPLGSHDTLVIGHRPG